MSEEFSEEKRIYFALLAHKNKRALRHQIANIKHFNPKAGIILYNGGSDPTFTEGLDVIVYPHSRPIRYGNLTPYLWSIMKWLIDLNINFDYLVNIDDDVLFIRKGFNRFLDRKMKNLDSLGWELMTGEQQEKRHAKHVAERMWNERVQWEPFFKSKDYLRYFNPGQVYRRSIIEKMVNCGYTQQIEDWINNSKVHATEEKFFVTLARGCGGRIGQYPYGHRYNHCVRWKRNITKSEIKKSLKNPNYFWVHPVKEKKLIHINRWLMNRKRG